MPFFAVAQYNCLNFIGQIMRAVVKLFCCPESFALEIGRFI